MCGLGDRTDDLSMRRRHQVCNTCTVTLKALVERPLPEKPMAISGWTEWKLRMDKRTVDFTLSRTEHKRPEPTETTRRERRNLSQGTHDGVHVEQPYCVTPAPLSNFAS